MKAGSRLDDGRLPGDVSQPAGAVIRTCIGCRQRVSVTDLLRVVVKPVARPVDAGIAPPSQDVVPDPRRRAAGRGAWLHPSPECVALAERRRAFSRALRSSVQLDPTAVRHYVESIAAAAAAESGKPDLQIILAGSRRRGTDSDCEKTSYEHPMKRQQ